MKLYLCVRCGTALIGGQAQFLISEFDSADEVTVFIRKRYSDAKELALLVTRPDEVLAVVA